MTKFHKLMFFGFLRVSKKNKRKEINKTLYRSAPYRNLPFFHSQNFRVTLFSDAPCCPKIFLVRFVGIQFEGKKKILH